MTSNAPTFDRYKNHKLACFDVPENITKLQRKALDKLYTLFYGRRDWRLKGFKSNHAAQVLTSYFTRTTTKAARSQRRHTDYNVLAALICRTNHDNNSQHFDFLQVAWVKITDDSKAGIVQLTGFSRSTVNASIARLKLAGLLRTRRNKNDTKTREHTATRWLTDTLFEMLGLGNWIKNIRNGKYFRKSKKPAPQIDDSISSISNPILRRSVKALVDVATDRPPPDKPEGSETN